MKKHLTLIALSITSFCSLQAHHILGGVMYYEYNGTSNDMARFEIILEMIRDKDGGGAQFDNPAEIGIWSKNDAGQIAFYQALNVYHNSIETLEFSEHVLFPHGRIVVAQVTEYRFSVNLPMNGNGYIIAHKRCCRIDDLLNTMDTTSSAPFEPGSTYTVEITPEAITMGNSSPKPTMFALDFLIPPGSFERNFAFTDSDGDLIRYEFVAPFTGGGIQGSTGVGGGDERGCDGIRPNPAECPPPFDPIDFRDGFTSTMPFGISTDVQLDVHTGRLFGTLDRVGFYLVGAVAREYRNEKLLSEVFMDYTFRVPLEAKVSGAYGYRFYDGNNNDIMDAGEPLVPDLLMDFTPPALESKFKSDGSYSMWTDIGQYQFTSLDPRFQVSANPPFVAHLDVESQQVRIDVPFVAAIPFTDLDLYIWDPWFLCNQKTKFKLMICNQGSTTQSGDILITLDSTMTYVESTETITQINDQQFIWHYDSLYPFDKEVLMFTVQMPSVDHVGEMVRISAQAVYYPILDPKDMDTTSYTVKGELRCSYDPNDKTTHPVRGNENLTLPNEYITYTIRFENTGNDTARQVRILDALSSQLDIHSLRMIGASHLYLLERIGNSLNIVFPDIYLPDSTANLEASKGYVIFKVKPVTSILIGETILNYARIFFDENDPIMTNTVINRIVSVPYPDTWIPSKDARFTLYPNPTSSTFTIRYQEYDVPRTALIIFNSTGLIMEEIIFDSNLIDIGHQYPAGIYFYELKTLDGRLAQRGKLIKSN